MLRERRSVYICTSFFALAVLTALTNTSIAADGPSDSGSVARIILLGTNGGPTPSKTRAEPANLLVVDGKPYLIDAGSGVDRQIALAGFKLAEIRNVFITHHHIDHDGGLTPLIAMTWFDVAWHGFPVAPVQIYGPSATQELVRTSLEFLSVSERIFRAGVPELAPSRTMFVGHDIDHDGQVFQDERVRVTAAENTHFHFPSEGLASGRDRSYSYRFDTSHGAVVFTGDTGPSDALVNLAQGADVLVSEVCDERLGASALTKLRQDEDLHMRTEHLTPQDVGNIAARAHVKTVILTHFVPGDDETDTTRFTDGVLRRFHGPVIAGRDLFEYDLR